MANIPDFKTLDEAVEFWESHDSADYFDDMEEVTIDVELRQNLLYPRLPILTHRPEHCPRCHQEIEHIVIEYVVWNNGHLVTIRDVPALQCRAGKHKYILEKTYESIEHLLDLETTRKIQPAETLQVPVFSLKMAI